MCNIRCRFDKLNKLIDLRKSQGIKAAFSRVYRENNSKEMINDALKEIYLIRYLVIRFLFLFQLIFKLNFVQHFEQCLVSPISTRSTIVNINQILSTPNHIFISIDQLNQSSWRR